MYYLSQSTLEGYDLSDFVYSYFHNSEAEISGIPEKMVLFCVDIKRKIKNKDISFSKGYREVCQMMGDILGGVLETKLDDEEKEFFKALLDFIPDSAIGDIPQIQEVSDDLI
jgi:predicted secreted protein